MRTSFLFVIGFLQLLLAGIPAYLSYTAFSTAKGALHEISAMLAALAAVALAVGALISFGMIAIVLESEDTRKAITERGK